MANLNNRLKQIEWRLTQLENDLRQYKEYVSEEIEAYIHSKTFEAWLISAATREDAARTFIPMNVEETEQASEEKPEEWIGLKRIGTRMSQDIGKYISYKDVSSWLIEEGILFKVADSIFVTEREPPTWIRRSHAKTEINYTIAAPFLKELYGKYNGGIY